MGEETTGGGVGDKGRRGCVRRRRDGDLCEPSVRGRWREWGQWLGEKKVEGTEAGAGRGEGRSGGG